MKSRKAIILAVLLIIITAITAIAHLSTRQEVPEHALLVSIKGEELLLDIDKFEYEQVSGIRVNGKGEEVPVEGNGIAVKEVLEKADLKKYSKISVIADDSYSAELSLEEINEDGKAYLLEDEEGLRLVVFGDKDSKRSVSNIAQIVVE